MIVLLSVAFADVVPMIECIPGAAQDGAHTAFCGPANTCEADTDCLTGHKCAEISLCVDKQNLPMGGGWAKPGSTFEANVVKGYCLPDKSCSTGSCDTAKRCLRPQAPPVQKGPPAGPGSTPPPTPPADVPKAPPTPSAPPKAPDAKDSKDCSTVGPVGGGALLIGLLAATRGARRRREGRAR